MEKYGLVAVCGLVIAGMVPVMAQEGGGGLRPPPTPPILVDGKDGPNMFQFKIEPNTPIKDLLPEPPRRSALTAPWLVKNLGDVPLLALAKPEPVTFKPPTKPLTQKERFDQQDREIRETQQAHAKTAHMMAKINHVNKDGMDQFIKVLRENRDDIAGLPFLLGDACRQSKERAREFVTGVDKVRRAMPKEPDPKDPTPNPADEANRFWVGYTVKAIFNKSKTVETPELTRQKIAALMQVLGPEDKAFRKGLVKHLAGIDHPEATRSLARLAVYSFEEEVRTPAIAALKSRDKEVYTSILVDGLRYPLAEVAKNAGEAVAQLERKDLVPQLVSVLDDADPRAPAELEVNGKKTTAVREVVKLNHHRSCVLCHPPAGMSGNNFDGKIDPIFVSNTGEFVTGPMPSPNVPFKSPSQGYNPFESPGEILVRVDATYLRQDFSKFEEVQDPGPWPKMQRFDYLVRTRAVDATEVAAYGEWLKAQGPAYVPPHRLAAVAALRTLTGRDAEPTAKAWRAVLGQ